MNKDYLDCTCSCHRGDNIKCSCFGYCCDHPRKSHNNPVVCFTCGEEVPNLIEHYRASYNMKKEILLEMTERRKKNE